MYFEFLFRKQKTLQITQKCHGMKHEFETSFFLTELKILIKII